jgi:hypothetical protein
MDGKRSAHHRAINRTGPHYAWLQRKAFHLSRVFRPGLVGERLVDQMRTIRPGLYEIPPSVVLEFRAALEDFRPYARDTEGTVWR